MSSLRQVVSHSPVRARQANADADAGRRRGHDRRGCERRSNIHPFESRDARLRFAAQAAGFGTYDMDCATGDSVWSPELRSIAGLPPSTEPLTTELVDSLLHPDDRPAFLEKLLASLDPGGSGEFEDEHRLLRPDGTICWVRTKGRTFFVGQGGERRPLAATGIVMDISAGRAAGQALAESREELDNLVDSAIDAIITIDAERRITRFNPASARMFGCSAAEALGSPVERFMPERCRGVHPDKVRRFAAGEAPAQTLAAPRRFAGLRANGEEFPFESTITKVKVGGHYRMTTFLRDITDRVRAEEALQRSKKDLELAIRGANIGTWHWNLRSGQVEFSDRCRQLFDIRPDEPLTYERALAAFHPDDRESVMAAHHRALEEGEEYHIEKRLLWSDGSIHWIQCIGRDLRDESSDEAVGMRGITIEVTARKAYEEFLEHSNEDLESRVAERTAELTRANEALEQSNLELQKFAFIAAHDLQTPLRSISGFAELLKQAYRGRLDAQADAWLDTLVRAARRMHDLIRDLLDYSRIDSRGAPFRPTDFNRLCDDVVEALDGAIRATGGQVTHDDLPTVRADRTQLGQLLQNLVDNGIKYHGAEPPRIHVSASRGRDEWLFSVRDNGIGIDEKYQDSVFDIFRRLHTQERYPGTGIGLAVCRRVVHRHGGRIWVESEPGRGSTFYFTLPDRQNGESRQRSD